MVTRWVARAGTLHGIDLTDAYRTVSYDARDDFEGTPGRPARYGARGIHAAAIVGGRAKIDGNPLALAVNLELDAAMFQWALRTRPGRVVYLSSSAAYPVGLQGTRDHRPLLEGDIQVDDFWPVFGTPDALYGWAKLTGERLAALARAEGVPVSVVRPFSGYSHDQSEDYPFPAFARPRPSSARTRSRSGVTVSRSATGSTSMTSAPRSSR